jgi:hypothetical protein
MFAALSQARPLCFAFVFPEVTAHVCEVESPEASGPAKRSFGMIYPK